MDFPSDINAENMKKNTVVKSWINEQILETTQVLTDKMRIYKFPIKGCFYYNDKKSVDDIGKVHDYIKMGLNERGIEYYFRIEYNTKKGKYSVNIEIKIK